MDADQDALYGGQYPPRYEPPPPYPPPPQTPQLYPQAALPPQPYPQPDPAFPQPPGWAPPAGDYPGAPGQPVPGSWAFGPPIPPPRKSRTGLVIGLVAGGVVVALLIIGGLVALTLNSSPSHKSAGALSPAPGGSTAPPPSDSTVPTPTPTPSPRKLVLPASAGGYGRQSGNVAKRLVDGMRSAMGGSTMANTVMSKAKIGLYDDGSGQRIIFIGISATDSPEAAAALEGPASVQVDQFFSSSGISHTDDYPPGDFGGVLRCGKGKNQGGGTITACVWSDGSTLGCVMSGIPTKSLAAITLKFRSSAEQRGAGDTTGA